MTIQERIQMSNSIRKFFSRHKDLYDCYEQQYIISMILHGNYPEDYHKEGIREILDTYKMIPKEENIYDAFLEEIKQAHGIEGRHILEVGGGPFVNLAKRIVLEQQSGTITVYDPRIMKPKETERMVLKKEFFLENTELGNTDLLIGLMPCKGAESLIQQATKNDIDFILWLCEGGPHGDYFDYFEDDQEWIECMKVIASRGVEQHKMGKMKIKYLPHFTKEYPIIYNEREK